MPYDLGPAAVAWLVAATFVAGFVRGYSGFGFSAMLIAASSLVTNPLNFVFVVVLLEALMSVQAGKGRRTRCGLATGWLADGWGRDRVAAWGFGS